MLFRSEVAGARKELERGGLTAPGIDAVLARADEHVERLPAKPETPPDATDAARRQRRVWRVGERARSVSGGWEGRVAEVDRAGRRATLEAGTMRVSVPIEDLELADATPGSRAAAGVDAGSGTNVAALRLARARSVPMSLDLRGARVDEALAALETYLNDASVAGLDRVTVVHGSGTGALRDAVRAQTAGHALVKEIRAGEGGEGGDGVTVVTLG